MLVIEYLHKLDLSEKSFTIQNKYFTTDVYKCMHAMYDMHDLNGSSVEYSYDHSSECDNKVL